ncbi:MULTISPECIES: PilZ domain-containing protein [Sphingomonas]|uniref:PilZ domain-containing protein n=1 Tax=Sphingomonas TaxID=13687 RepID=UPI000DEFA876|nr:MULTISPECIES: PilZ domain-containing protein [Sphingomonas]
MSGSVDSSGEAQRRVAERTHLYLAAMLRWDGAESVVRIRNLSAHGAMIEGATLPPPGQLVALSRGQLRVTGRAAWTHAGRSGLQLDQPIDVKGWNAAPANRGQARVDGLIAALRSRDAPVAWPSEAARPAAGDDLRLAQRLLTELADQLAGDNLVVARCGRQLQQLDLVVQLLGALGEEGGVLRLGDLRLAVRSALLG